MIRPKGEGKDVFDNLLGTEKEKENKSKRKNKHKKDSSNYTAKAEIDGLVVGGLIPDDSTDYVRKVSFEVQYGDEDKTIINIC